MKLGESYLSCTVLCAQFMSPLSFLGGFLSILGSAHSIALSGAPGPEERNRFLIVIIKKREPIWWLTKIGLGFLPLHSCSPSD